MNKIKVGSDFSGVGAFDQALKRLGINYETVFSCDMDKFARQTYIHNYGEPKYYPFDVYDREIPKESLDIYMTSPPCQSFSLAGKRKGENSKNGVLFYNSHEFIKENKPRYFIFENVKGLLSDDSGKTIQRWFDFLGGKSVNGNPVIFPHEESVPYHIYYQVLNAKNYGIPQNRERIFIIGIRDDSDNEFSFPKPFPLEKRLKDVLEKYVDEKYFLSETMIEGFMKKNERIGSDGEGFGFKPTDVNEISSCITSRYYKQSASDVYIDVKKLGFINQDTQASQVFSENGTSPNICAGTHGYANGYVEVKSATKQGFEIAELGDSINLEHPDSETRRGRVGKGVSQTLTTICNQGVVVELNLPGKHEQNSRVYNSDGIAPTLTTMQGVGQEPKVVCFGRSDEEKKRRKEQYQKTGKDTGSFKDKNLIIKDQEYYDTILASPNPQKEGLISQNFKIRRLTPRECFNLMDFGESFTWPVSDSQAYKQAGNSICVGVLVEILKKIKI